MTIDIRPSDSVPIAIRYPQTRTPEPQPYWNLWRVLAVVALIIGTPVLLAVSCLAISTNAMEREIARVNAVAEKLQAEELATMKAMQKDLVRSVQIKTPHTVTIQIPGRSVADCKAVTGGVINEAWQKCRNGYIEQRSEYR